MNPRNLLPIPYPVWLRALPLTANPLDVLSMVESAQMVLSNVVETLLTVANEQMVAATELLGHHGLTSPGEHLEVASPHQFLVEVLAKFWGLRGPDSPAAVAAIAAYYAEPSSANYYSWLEEARNAVIREVLEILGLELMGHAVYTMWYLSGGRRTSEPAVGTLAHRQIEAGLPVTAYVV